MECHPGLDPDLQIRGTGHPDPEMGEDLYFFFRPFGSQFSRKLDIGEAPSTGSVTALDLSLYFKKQKMWSELRWPSFDF